MMGQEPSLPFDRAEGQPAHDVTLQQRDRDQDRHERHEADDGHLATVRRLPAFRTSLHAATSLIAIMMTRLARVQGERLELLHARWQFRRELIPGDGQYWQADRPTSCCQAKDRVPCIGGRPRAVVEWQMRAWWSIEFVPQKAPNLRIR
jgi:hypothetical protein